MSTETITVAKTLEKGADLIGKVIAVSDIKKGTGKNGPWQMQTATLKDNSGQITVTMWGDDVGTLDQGQYVKIEGLFWKEYKDELQPNFGKFTKVSLANEEQMLPATEADTHADLEPIPNMPTSTATKLPPIEVSVQGLVHANTILIAQIEQEVFATLKSITGVEARGDKVGMYTRMNFYHIKGMAGKD
jgi:hypothetical protein